MNGPAHYSEADFILTGDDGTCEYSCPHSGCAHEMAFLARAQVHATLALVAAVMVRTGLAPADRHEWMKAINPEYAGNGIAAEVTP